MVVPCRRVDASLDIQPLLLVVRAPDPDAPRSIQLELLGMDGAGWRALTTWTAATGLEEPGSAELVALNGGFALIASDETAGRTFVSLIEPDPAQIRQVVTRLELIGPAAAGSADVDGDGSAELILIGQAVTGWSAFR